MKPSGRGDRPILFVSEYPGPTEDEHGEPLVGGTGRFLASECERIGIDMRRDCILTNAIICYSKNVAKHKTAVADCRPNLLRTIKEHDPISIVLLGGSAIRSLISHVWDYEAGQVGRWAGRKIPAHNPNVWIFPTYNPAHLIREDKDTPIKLRSLRRTLRQVHSTEDRPWRNPPDYGSRVQVIHDDKEAAERLDKYTSGLIAFDFETTCLKPEGPGSEIVCASVCWNGKETIAFPWYGKVRDAMRRLLTNPDVGKIGFNSKFEDRWTRQHLGIAVVGWTWCGMLAAHAIDPRPGTSGLAFQSFVRYGQPYYSHHIDPYLESRKKGGYEVNQAKRVSLPSLMKYCGLDSLLEYLVAIDQSEELEVNLESD